MSFRDKAIGVAVVASFISISSLAQELPKLPPLPPPKKPLPAKQTTAAKQLPAKGTTAPAKQVPPPQPAARTVPPAAQPPKEVPPAKPVPEARGGGARGPQARGPQPAVQGPVYVAGRGVRTTRNPDGTQTHVDPRTRLTVHTDAVGHVNKVERPGLAATNFRPDGHAGHIEQNRQDGSKLVVNRTGGAREVYVERQVRPGVISRTFVSGGQTRVQVYRTYTYHSVPYETYVPPRTYQPAFYTWTAQPWGTRVVYSWGPPAPWYYGGYFRPEPVYDSPALWLTDFLLISNLQMAYSSQQQGAGGAPPPPGPVAPLTPEVKFAISEDVKRQTMAEDPSTQPPPPPPGTEVEPQVMKQKVFIVASTLDVVSSDDHSMCTLAPGDVIQRNSRVPVTADGNVTVDVMNSRGGCPEDFRTQLNVAQLEDMRNQERAQLALGMADLADGQVKGVPAGPPAGAKASPDGQPPAAANLDAQAIDREADQTEAELQKSIAGGQ